MAPDSTKVSTETQRLRRYDNGPDRWMHAAGAEGLTLGRLTPKVLGEQIDRGGRVFWREWVSRGITIDEFKNKALRGVYVGLAAYATPELHRYSDTESTHSDES